MAAPTYGYDDQPPPGLKPMSVPERIQLTSSDSSPADQPSNKPAGQYRPMKVPDKITLGELNGVQGGVAERQSTARTTETGSEGRGGMATTAVTGIDRYTIGENRELLPVQAVTTKEDPIMGDSHRSSSVDQRLLELEMRVQSLENEVARVAVGSGGSRNGPNRFWYVLTFAGWMMVPLIVVYVFHYKKNF